MDYAGSWELVSFDLEKDGVKTPWGTGLSGLLIYSPAGQMSVSINKGQEKDPSQSEAENLLDSLLFYAGTYRIEGNVIRHQVTNASNLTRIGKEMIRYANLDHDLMTLTTPDEPFGRAILVWRRIG